MGPHFQKAWLRLASFASAVGLLGLLGAPNVSAAAIVDLRANVAPGPNAASASVAVAPPAVSLSDRVPDGAFEVDETQEEACTEGATVARLSRPLVRAACAPWSSAAVAPAFRLFAFAARAPPLA